jgi:hypothetical protein
VACRCAVAGGSRIEPIEAANRGVTK